MPEKRDFFDDLMFGPPAPKVGGENEPKEDNETKPHDVVEMLQFIQKVSPLLLELLPLFFSKKDEKNDRKEDGKDEKKENAK